MSFQLPPGVTPLPQAELDAAGAAADAELLALMAEMGQSNPAPSATAMVPPVSSDLRVPAILPTGSGHSAPAHPGPPSQVSRTKPSSSPAISSATSDIGALLGGAAALLAMDDSDDDLPPSSIPQAAAVQPQKSSHPAAVTDGGVDSLLSGAAALLAMDDSDDDLPPSSITQATAVQPQPSSHHAAVTDGGVDSLLSGAAALLAMDDSDDDFPYQSIVPQDPSPDASSLPISSTPSRTRKQPCSATPVKSAPGLPDDGGLTSLLGAAASMLDDSDDDDFVLIPKEPKQSTQVVSDAIVQPISSAPVSAKTEIDQLDAVGVAPISPEAVTPSQETTRPTPEELEANRREQGRKLAESYARTAGVCKILGLATLSKLFQDTGSVVARNPAAFTVELITSKGLPDPASFFVRLPPSARLEELRRLNATLCEQRTLLEGKQRALAEMKSKSQALADLLQLANAGIVLCEKLASKQHQVLPLFRLKSTPLSYSYHRRFGSIPSREIEVELQRLHVTNVRAIHGRLREIGLQASGSIGGRRPSPLHGINNSFDIVPVSGNECTINLSWLFNIPRKGIIKSRHMNPILFTFNHFKKGFFSDDNYAMGVASIPTDGFSDQAELQSSVSLELGGQSVGRLYYRLRIATPLTGEPEMVQECFDVTVPEPLLVQYLRKTRRKSGAQSQSKTRSGTKSRPKSQPKAPPPQRSTRPVVSPKQPTARPVKALTQRQLLELQQKAHSVEGMNSVEVLEHEIQHLETKMASGGQDEFAAAADAAILVNMQTRLHQIYTAYDNQSLTPQVYAELLEKSIHDNLLFAKKFKDGGSEHDLERCVQRIRIMKAELLEVKENL